MTGAGESGTPGLDAGKTVERLRTTGIALPFAALFITLSIASSSFLTKVNLLNILDQQAAILIIAAAGTLVLVAGGIDLSVGAVYALAGVTAAEVAQHTTPAVAIVLGVASGSPSDWSTASSSRACASTP